MVFWNDASTLKQYFVLPKNGSKDYLKYTFLAFPVFGILALGTPLVVTLFVILFFGSLLPSVSSRRCDIARLPCPHISLSVLECNRRFSR